MAGKGKFLYVTPPVGGEQGKMKVADSAYTHTEETKGYPLHLFSTDDLLKVKAQIATELENRMDLDEVIEGNLEKLKTKISASPSEVIAKLLRQTIERLDVVSADEKRAKTRKEILEDELRHRMIQDGQSEVKFAGLISATYKTETVYSVQDGDWAKVYSGIVADTIDNNVSDDVAEQVAKNLALEEATDKFQSDVDEVIEHFKQRAKTAGWIDDTNNQEVLEMLDEIHDNIAAIEPDFGEVQLVRDVTDGLVTQLRQGINDIDAFGIIQKRLTSTTLNDLVKQGYSLPAGIESQEIRKIKTKRTK